MPKDYENYIFKNLEVLICGNMRLNWSDVLKFAKIFPNIQELRVPSNNITSLNIPVDEVFTKLKILDMENNPIGLWSEINKLGNLPQLEELILENCNLQEIKFSGSAKKIADFGNLKKLILNKNNIRTVSN